MKEKKLLIEQSARNNKFSKRSVETPLAVK